MAAGPQPKTVRARILGRVQGVWYRRWTVERANALGLAGWVRNRDDGSVEALFSGPAAAVDVMLADCRHGPPAARVDGISVTPDEPPATAGFHELPTV
ncbi:MAG: acylphosphatase [Azospirillum sp.]|nr:acylphosphatase [Azospirillum sp.]